MGCLESIIEYFNKWAFVYVGIYGYGYIDSSKAVVSLFKNRGWTAIINDDLINNVLAFVSLGIGVLSGGIGVAAAAVWYKVDENEEKQDGALYVIFFLGLLLGAGLSSVVFNLISSAVATIMVLFAETPVDFQRNHEELYKGMSAAWMNLHPNLWNANAMQSAEEEQGGGRRSGQQGGRGNGMFANV